MSVADQPAPKVLTGDGTPGEESRTSPDPEVKWVTVAEGTRTPGDQEDRAGKYLPEQNLLLINGDFRVYDDMVERWCKQYAQAPGARNVVQEVVREWFEQALIETVLGVVPQVYRIEPLGVIGREVIPAVADL